MKEILETGNYQIKLKDGSHHRLEPEEITVVSKIVPWYMQSHAKFPIIIEYISTGGRRVFRVRGEKWDRRLVEVLLKGEFSVEGKEILEYDELIKLVALYKSLLIIILSI